MGRGIFHPVFNSFTSFSCMDIILMSFLNLGNEFTRTKDHSNVLFHWR